MSSVSLWIVPTDRPLPPDYDSILAPDEQSKAQRLHFPQDQHRYRLMRTVLRRLLAQTLNCDPKKLRFSYSPKGKPTFKNPDVPIHFNISHSGDYGLIGIAQDQLIGVDLELMQSKPNFINLAQRFFAPSENLWLTTKTAAEQQQIFYQFWTAKEAFLKATGLGISGGLDRVIVSETLQQYESLPEPYQVNHWQLLSQPFFDHYWGAIALNQTDAIPNSVKIQPYQWE
jgi:4'-phosphopantetheinyl transferase